ncbi:glycosyltransferase family 4 protein [Actinokineospora sp. NPDC004072]
MILAGRRVAVVNWRDRGHRLAGGAEEYAHRMADALAAAGAEVVFVTARDAGQAARGDGVVRRGGRWTVYPWALLWLWRERGRLDAVVDCQNGIPFFSPLVVGRGTAVVQVVHHVHDAQFGVHFPAWLAAVGRWLEGPAARRVYRRATTVAVSRSTVAAMRSRLGWTGPIRVVHNGVEPVAVPPRRDARPTLVCLGRLVAHKRVDRLIEVVAELRERWPDLRLHVVGGGPMEHALRERAAGLGGAVVVHGFVPPRRKSELLGRAWLHVALSDGEGWGLSVLEAAAHGVPTLCRDVDGLRDSVRPGETGWLVPDGRVADALHRALLDLADPAVAAVFAARCRAWAGRFDWAGSGAEFTAVVAELVGGRVGVTSL